MSEQKWTPGPWPTEYTGDGKRITIGKGLVEGPNGYEVAEVYSDDCPQEVAEANAALIAAAPDFYAALNEALGQLALIQFVPKNYDLVRKIGVVLAKARGEAE